MLRLLYRLAWTSSNTETAYQGKNLCMPESLSLPIKPQEERKKIFNVEKSHKSAHVCPMFYLFPQRLRGPPTPQLDTVIIEVSSGKGLSQRGNTLRP